MRTKTEKKIAIALMAALIFVFVPVIRQDTKAKAANGSAVIAASESFEDTTTDWLVMVERLDQAIQNGTGQNVSFLTGNHFEIPTDILGRLAGKNATLALHTSNGVTFSISGRDICAASTPVVVDVSFESVIPDEVKRQIPEQDLIREFSMEQKDAYPCCLNVHLGLGEEHAGKHAVLYSYDESSGRLRQEGIFRINSLGHAMFGLQRGDEYVVAVYSGYTVKPGDTLSHVAVRNGISLRTLMSVNPQIKNVDQIQIGQLVNLPN